MNKLSSMGFALIAILIAYIAMHGAIYFFLLKFFKFGAVAKNVTIYSLVFLAISFVLAMALSHRWDNVFTRAYYFSSGVWIGFMINLVLFFGLGWIVISLSSLSGRILNEKLIGYLAVLAAVIYSAYGIWNAFNPVVKKIDVSIENLPQEWVDKKIIQISDVHLGHVYRDDYMRKIAQRINALQGNVIVITGDLFDGMDGNLDMFIEPINMLHAPKGVYYVSGNHETYLGLDKTFEIIKKTNLTALRDSVRTVDGLQFIGIDYPNRFESKNVAADIEQMPGFDRSKPSVLLWHMPVQIDSIKRLGISLMLSGHTHNGQLFPFGFITEIIFKGYDNGLKQEGSFSEYTSTGLGGWGPPMRTEQRSEIVEITLHRK